MDRTLLGLARGDRREGLQLQWTDRGGDSLALDPLHDEAKVGTFAVVYRGRVAHGSWHIPVAIKVQRDEPRTPEDADSAVARFDAEAKLHRDRLRRPDIDGRVPLPVVAHIELATTAGEEADRIPPSILCRRAAHALALLCPTCGTELESPEDQFDSKMPTPPAGRVLVCPDPKCPGPWKDTPDARHTLHAAAVARQPRPCDGCERFGGPPDACLPDSRILNFFPARLLVFELLGESLAQFLRRPSPAGPRFPPRTDGRAPRPREWLTTACHLLSDVLDGMEFLHGRQVWHLDLKPDNVCLRAAPDRPRGVLIDLGLAGDPAAPAKFREAMAALPLETDYAPAELRRPTLTGTYEVEKLNGNRARVRFDLSSATPDPTDPILLVGETVALTGGRRTIRGTVEQVVGAQAVFAFAAGEPSDRGQLTVYRATGPAADYFSFGLLAAALLVRRPELTDLRDLARNLEVALRELDKVRPLADCPGREVVRRLAAARNHTGFLQPFLRLHADIRKDYGDAAFLAEELLGLALRCLARGVAGWSVSEHRAACPDDGRRRVRRALDAVRDAVVTAELGEQWAAAEQARKERAARLRAMANDDVLKWPTTGGRGDPAGLREVIALLPVDSTAEAAEVRHAAHLYGKAAGHFTPHLDGLFDAPKGNAGDGPLVRLLVWARGVAPGEGDMDRLLKLRERLPATPQPSVSAKWLQDVDGIAELLNDYRAAALQVQRALSDFRALVYERVERAGARVYVGREAAHGRIDMAAATRAAASLAGGFLARLAAEREALVRDGTAVLNRWQATAAPLLRALLLASEKKLEVDLQRVGEEDKVWAVSLSRDAAVVSKYLTAVTKIEPAGLWSRWVAEAERPLSFLERNLWGANRQVELTPAEAAPNALDKAADAVNRILRDPLLLGPAVAAACRLLLAEYDMVSRSRQLTLG